MTRAFPSGVQFDSLDIHNDVLLVALPPSKRLHLRDVKYLATMAEGLGLVGVSVAMGDFATFVPTRAYRQYCDGEITEQEFIRKWR